MLSFEDVDKVVFPFEVETFIRGKEGDWYFPNHKSEGSDDIFDFLP
jgi:hypothetical protein